MKLLKVVLYILLGLAAVTAQARTFDQIKKAGKIVIASEGKYPPFNYFEGSKLTGFEVEVGDAVAKKLGLKVEWKALAFESLLIGLGQDRWDLVIASHGITEERAKAVTFTDPHYCSGGVIVAKNPSVKTAKDLAGKIVAVQTGTTYLDSAKTIPGVKEVKNFPQDTDARSAVVAGRADVWVTDKFVAKEAMGADPKAGLKIGDFLFVEKIAGAVKKGNTSLAQEYNKALAQVLQDGTYKAISEKYFKEDIRCR